MNRQKLLADGAWTNSRFGNISICRIAALVLSLCLVIANSSAYGQCDCGVACCNCAPPACWNVGVDAMFLTRSSGEDQVLFRDVINNVDAFTSSDLGFSGVDTGFRVSMSRESNACWNPEVVYSYIEFDEGNHVVGATNQFNTMFAGFVGFSDIDMFQTRYTSEFHNIEVNARRRIWHDCVNVSIGFRYVELNESAGIDADAGGGVIDMLDTTTKNQLVGLQIGTDAVLYCRGVLAIDGLAKVGVLSNTANQMTFANEPLGINRRADEGSEDGIAVITELGINATVQLSQSVVVRAGYSLLWLQGVALAPDQWNDINFSTPTMSVIDDSGDVLAHGGILGVEKTW